ncbi:hypothetical protein RZS08_38330, partial [Arthrospira platensis SPKY1]|nr:hypothetical protein [Arthrospira platensis SPKY1]
MKLFQTSTKKPTPPPDGVDVQSAPAPTDPAAGKASAQIKVDLTIQTGNTLLVAGWRTRPVEVGIVLNGETASAREIEIDRP